MRIAVFGATGSIGVHNSLFLKKDKGHKVVALGHRNSDYGFFLTQEIEYYSVDIRENTSC